jgi:DhnA family fructose-bisphosphate aldolase class Ia
MSNDGVLRRVARILPQRPTLMFAVDGSLIDGPDGALLDPPALFSGQLFDHVDSLLCFRGTLIRYTNELLRTAVVENLSASTMLSRPTEKVLIGSPNGALRDGADGISFQLHISDARENRMLERLGNIIERAHKVGLPVLVTAYPRRMIEGEVDHYKGLRERDSEAYATLVRHGVRIAAELGADIIKTTYTGTRQSLVTVVDAAIGVPILVAGGAKMPDEEAAAMAVDALNAGAWGVAYGRQIYHSADPVRTAAVVKMAMLNAVH